jgi:ribonuclease P protein component
VDESVRLGQTVPKRYARRAVSRSLIRRQARAAFERHAERLARGDWFIRLRAPFAPAQFPSAASPSLKQAVKSELDTLFAAAVA